MVEVTHTDGVSATRQVPCWELGIQRKRDTAPSFKAVEMQKEWGVTPVYSKDCDSSRPSSALKMSLCRAWRSWREPSLEKCDFQAKT